MWSYKVIPDNEKYGWTVLLVGDEVGVALPHKYAGEVLHIILKNGGKMIDGYYMFFEKYDQAQQVADELTALTLMCNLSGGNVK
jgi:hypothetical protein